MKLGNRGVPQGSVISPFLFNIFINDLLVQIEEYFLDKLGNSYRILNDLKCQFLAYADDIAIICPFDIDFINGVLQLCYEWSIINGLEFAPDKCKALPIGKVTHNIIQPKFNNIDIEIVDSFKYLGLVIPKATSNKTYQFYKSESFKSKVTSVNIDFADSKRYLINTKYGLNANLGLLITKLIIIPRLSYAFEVHNYTQQDVKAISKILIQHMNIVMCTFKSTSKKSLFDFTGTEDPHISIICLRILFLKRLLDSPSDVISSHFKYILRQFNTIP